MSAERLTALNLEGFQKGHDARAYQKLGAHALEGGRGVSFAVWAPNARDVSVIGDFNDWTASASPLIQVGATGVWHGVIREARVGSLYKYRITSDEGGYVAEKADPFGSQQELPPGTASVVEISNYAWRDEEWLQARKERNSLHAPISIYEMHLGSWKRVAEEKNRSLSYRELAAQLPDYLAALGFTHVELMPVMEHPFFGSWGYEVTGYFAPSSRFGSPSDLRALIDSLHQRGIGVILDWVPAHFPTDAHGLGFFDGTHLFEHQDPRKGFHPEWNSFIFNYGRHEVRSFLLSSALYWLEEFHADGLRVDGVSSMLYLDYARKAGEWIPNAHGGRENTDAVTFLRELNEVLYREHPDVQIIAEESTSWPHVTKPTNEGGLGFGLKWDMGFMHDTLDYLRNETIYRAFHQSELTFRSMYAYSESFVLPLSHDEVVYGKKSLVSKMPGDEWQRRATLRLLYSYMWAQPGKKLLFMGGEIGQRSEWNHDGSLEWQLLRQPGNGGIARTVGTLNELYRSEPALHRGDVFSYGFEWIDGSNARESVFTFLRWSEGRSEEDVVLVALNFTPVPRMAYRIEVPFGGRWEEIFNSDAGILGGSGQGNLGGVEARPILWNGRNHSINVVLPPLGAVFFKPLKRANARS